MRVLRALVLFVVLGLAVLLGALWLDHRTEVTLPMPTGPFAVGRAMYAWADDVHSDTLAPVPGTKRELLVWMWYPAVPRQRSQTIDDYLPAPGGQPSNGRWAWCSRNC